MKKYIKSAITPYWDEPKEVLRELARDPHTRQDTLKSLAEHPDPIVRFLVLTNPAAAEWAYQKSTLTDLDIDDDIRLGIDLYYAGSAYGGTNPEVLKTICKNVAAKSGAILNDSIYVHNLDASDWCNEETGFDGENCVYVEIRFRYPHGYEYIVEDQAIKDLEAVGCEVLSTDYY